MRAAAEAVRLAWGPARWSVTGYAALAVVGAGVPVGAAWLTKLILDRVTKPPIPVADVLALALGLAAAAALAGIQPQVARYLQARLRRRVGLHAMDRLYAAVDRLPGLRPFEDPVFLDRVSLAQQAGSSPTLVLESTLEMAGAAAVCVGFVVSLATVSPIMIVALLGTSVPAVAAQLWLSRRHGSAYWEISPRQRREMFYAGLLTNVRAAKEVRLFGAGDFLRGRMRTERRAVNAIEERLDVRTLLVHGALALLAAAVAGSGLVWVVTAAAGGRLSAGDVTMFLASVAGVQSALGTTIAAAARTHQYLLLFEHYVAVQKPAADLPVAPSGRAMPSLHGAIELRDVWFRYGPSHPWVLRGVNLMIPCGQSIALVGRNGSGKSTIAKILCRFYDPTHGTVLWDGVDVREFAVEDLRTRISAVFQDFMQYDLTAAENIALSDVDTDPSRHRIKEAAELAGAHETVARLPHGYDTPLTRTFVTEEGPDAGVILSGGQWQRLALARALLRDRPDLLILDEPSSGLDAEAEREIHVRLRDHRDGRTSVLISHRLSAVRDADRIVVLADGLVAETGDHDSLIAAGGIYADLFTTQASGYLEGTSVGR